MPTETEATKFFLKHRPKKDIEYLSFVGEVDNKSYYEIWYEDEGEYYVSFVGYDPVTGYFFVDSISQLLNRINAHHKIMLLQIEALKERRAKFWVGAFAFMISLAVLFVLAFTGEGKVQQAAIVAGVLGVVASGSVFIFGVWIPGGGKKAVAP